MPDITTLLGAAGLKIDGPHNPAKEYKKYYVVTQNGCSYVYINDGPSTGSSLYDTAYWLCMAEGIKADGLHNPDKEYSKGMLVSSNGGSYLYVNDLPSSVSILTDTTHWQQIAAQGATGLSAYQAAVSAGYTGTEAEFNTAMGGLPGATQAANDAAGLVNDKMSNFALMQKIKSNLAIIYPVSESKIDYNIELQAAQSGAGDPAPDNVRPIAPSIPSAGTLKVRVTGKNLAKIKTSGTSSVHNVTYTYNEDGSVTFSGAASGGASITYHAAMGTLPMIGGRRYRFRPVPSVEGLTTLIRYRNPGGSATEASYNFSSTPAGLEIAPLPGSYDFGLYTYVSQSNYGYNGKTIRFQIEDITDTNHVLGGWEEYVENEVTITNTTGSDWYGLPNHPVEIKDGQVINRTGYIDSYVDEDVPDGYISSTGGLDTGAQIVYPLSEPVVTAITTPPLYAVKQNDPYIPKLNRVTPSAGELTVGYYKALISERAERVDKAMLYIRKGVGSSYSGIRIMYLYGNTSGMTKDDAKSMTFRLWDGRNGNCSVKWQGSSSIAYPKKNYNITMETGIQIETAWGVQNKYCLKANFIDYSHARNTVSAKLWGEMVKARSVVPAWVANTPNAGAIDGFPIMLYINDKYMGLYSFNVPKDKWMFGMNGSGTEAVLSAEAYTAATRMQGLALVDGSDFKVEHSSGLTQQQIKDSINNVISKFVTYSSDVWDYVSLDSVIDAVIFTALLTAEDIVQKNYLLTTYDGAMWYFNEYDLDSTFGNAPFGYSYYATISPPHIVTPYSNYGIVVMREKKTEFKARYAALRAGVLSESNVYSKFYNYLANIPKAMMDLEADIWPQIPGTLTNNVDQIMTNYGFRCKFIDAQVAAL